MLPEKKKYLSITLVCPQVFRLIHNTVPKWLSNKLSRWLNWKLQMRSSNEEMRCVIRNGQISWMKIPRMLKLLHPTSLSLRICVSSTQRCWSWPREGWSKLMCFCRSSIQNSKMMTVGPPLITWPLKSTSYVRKEEYFLRSWMFLSKRTLKCKD